MSDNKTVLERFKEIKEGIKILETETGEKAIEAKKRIQENMDELDAYFGELERKYYQENYDPEELRVFPNRNRKRH